MSEPKIIYLGPACEADSGDLRMDRQWKLVPVEPTETMVINGFESEPNECFTDEEVWEQYQDMSGCQQAAFRAKLCWAAMLASAPEPPPADAGEIARLTAERDALQQRLNAADQRIDELTAPAGYCLMPTSLTAENGAKSLLMGEFSVSQQHVCPECATTGEAPDDDCDICEGLGSYTQHTPISWDTMKEIYSKVVGSLAKKPNTPQ